MKLKTTTSLKIVKLKMLRTITYQVWMDKELLGHFNEMQQAIDYVTNLIEANNATS